MNSIHHQWMKSFGGQRPALSIVERVFRRLSIFIGAVMNLRLITNE